jgi:hypothetical protein
MTPPPWWNGFDEARRNTGEAFAVRLCSLLSRTSRPISHCRSRRVLGQLVQGLPWVHPGRIFGPSRLAIRDGRGILRPMRGLTHACDWRHPTPPTPPSLHNLPSGSPKSSAIFGLVVHRDNPADIGASSPHFFFLLRISSLRHRPPRAVLISDYPKTHCATFSKLVALLGTSRLWELPVR